MSFAEQIKRAEQCHNWPLADKLKRWQECAEDEVPCTPQAWLIDRMKRWDRSKDLED